MGEAGLEPSPKSIGNPPTPPQGGAKSGALGAQKPVTTGPTDPGSDPDLDALIRAWPILPDAIRTGIAAMVKAARCLPA